MTFELDLEMGWGLVVKRGLETGRFYLVGGYSRKREQAHEKLGELARMPGLA